MDDNKVIRQLIRVNLELEGLEVVTAADGAECLDVVHQVRPDVVTLDVVMPRLDGLRTAAVLRADPRTRDLPLAIVSACTQYEVDGGLDIGVDAFLAKPFEPAELISLVRRLIERKRSRESEVDVDGRDAGDAVFGESWEQERQRGGPEAEARVGSRSSPLRRRDRQAKLPISAARAPDLRAQARPGPAGQAPDSGGVRSRPRRSSSAGTGKPSPQ